MLGMKNSRLSTSKLLYLGNGTM